MRSPGTYLILLLLFVGGGCGKVADGSNNSTANNNIADSRPVNNKPALEYNGKKLSPTMTDAEILQVFGVDIAKASSNRSQGPDGFSMTYTLGEQTFSIARSAVTGVNVMAFGPIKGDWNLGN